MNKKFESLEFEVREDEDKVLLLFKEPFGLDVQTIMLYKDQVPLLINWLTEYLHGDK